MARFDKLEFRQQSATSPAAEEKRRLEATDAHWMQQADGERRVGHYENALRLYSRALEINRTLVAGWVGQVRMLIELEEYPEAETWSRKALELFPSHPELLAAQAQTLCRMRDLKGAHLACDGAMQQSGQSAYRWIVRGELLLAGRLDMDRHCFDKAEQVDSGWLVPLEIARIYLHYEQAARALLRIRVAVEKAPDQYYCWHIQGVCQAKLCQDRQALHSFQQCIKLCPGHVEAERAIRELQRRGWSPFRWFRGLIGRT